MAHQPVVRLCRRRRQLDVGGDGRVARRRGANLDRKLAAAVAELLGDANLAGGRQMEQADHARVHRKRAAADRHLAQPLRAKGYHHHDDLLLYDCPDNPADFSSFHSPNLAECSHHLTPKWLNPLYGFK
jgi:hypothetical protein